MKRKLNDTITSLKLKKITEKKLLDMNLNTIEDLWKCSRKDLKTNNLTDSEITNVQVKLQLIGLDLSKKVYSRD